MSINRRRLRLNTVAVSLGCGCGKPKLSDVFLPKPKPKAAIYHNPDLYSSSSSSWYKRVHSNYDEDDTTTNRSATPFSLNFDSSSQFSEAEPDTKSSRTVLGFGRIGGESVAVEKDSDDPYLDFRHSMLQMILEKEIYSKDDLRELLNCFLQLNSPYHHGIIRRAFTEIWNGVFSVRSASPQHRFGRKSGGFYMPHVQ